MRLIVTGNAYSAQALSALIDDPTIECLPAQAVLQGRAYEAIVVVGCGEIAAELGEDGWAIWLEYIAMRLLQGGELTVH